jgi:hypothetical protein
MAHRVSFELYKGPIPEGLVILHACDNPQCVKPEHLTAGTRKQNSDDKVLRNRQSKGDDHGGSKLSESQVTEIRDYYLSGTLNSQIAELFDVSVGTIKSLVSGVNWKHLGGDIAAKKGGDDWKERISDSLVGKSFTDEHLVNLRTAHAARRGTDRSVPWNKGIPMSDETKQKVSASKIGHSTGVSADPLIEAARRQKISAARKGRKFTEEHKAALRAAKARRREAKNGILGHVLHTNPEV